MELEEELVAEEAEGQVGDDVSGLCFLIGLPQRRDIADVVYELLLGKDEDQLLLLLFMANGHQLLMLLHARVLIEIFEHLINEFALVNTFLRSSIVVFHDESSERHSN